MSNLRVIKQDVRRQEKIRRKRSMRRRRLQRRKNVLIAIFVLLVVFFAGRAFISNWKTENTMSANKQEVEKQDKKEVKSKGENKKPKRANNKKDESKKEIIINAPRDRSKSEVLSEMAQLAEDNELIASIYEDYKMYSDELLALVVNNPETAEFVAGYLDRKETERIQVDSKIQKENYPLFLQWDQRWGYRKYGDSIIGLAGCGPTCLSMVLCSLTNDISLTPDVVAKFSDDNGHYVRGTGTSWSLMTEGAKNYGLVVEEVSLSEASMKERIDNGEIMICAVGKGDFTVAGHFVVIYGYDKEGFRINDPNCKYRSSIAWSFERLSSQIKMLWSYSKE